jgi:toxin YoeB
MRVDFTDDAWADYQYWIKADRKIAKRINLLIMAAQQNPRSGIGKPEPLKYGLSGLWSRRINAEHRLVYKIHEEGIVIIQCRYHYG